jgi:hypothetical protein
MKIKEIYGQVWWHMLVMQRQKDLQFKGRPGKGWGTA